MKSTLLTIIGLSTFLFALLSPFTFAQLQEEDGQEISSSIPDKINLSISNITVSKSPTGLMAINGIIFNNTTENLQEIKVDIFLYDAKNNTIRETSRYVTDPFSTFEPGSTESFSFLMDADDFNHYNATSYGERIQ